MRTQLRAYSRLALLLAMLFGSLFSYAQGNSQAGKKEIPQVALEHIRNNKQQLNVTDEDIADLELSSETDSKKSGVKHYYIKQLYQGIEIYGAITNMSINREGSVINVGNRFHKEIGKKVKGNQPGLDAAGAVAAAAKYLGITLRGSLTVLERGKGRNQEVTFSKGGISLEPVKAKLVYQPMEDGSLRLAWEVAIYTVDAMNYWVLRLDAESGKVLDKDNLVAHCNFENDGPAGRALHESHMLNASSAPYAPEAKMAAATLTSNYYNVYPMPSESPIHGNRVAISNTTADPVASPSGWHKVGATTFATTRGNNVFAYEDPDNTGYNGAAQEVYGYSPDGSANLVFDFPIDFTKEPVTYRDAAIANLFYWNNLIHDVWYQYGFDEISGNFQADNFGKGGIGGDHVMAEAQDSRNILTTRNNANFATTPEGQRPRMQMYLWSGIPDQDMFRITSPTSMAGSYPAAQAAFGPRLNSTPVTGKLVIGVSADGCSALTNAAEIAGNIAVLYRGSCEFGVKVLNAQNAGAIAVVVINNAPGAPTTMSVGATNPSLITISSVMVSDVTGASIRTQLDAGQEVMIALKDDGSGPEFDGDLDNGIIAHEYGHGISNKLTGGPNTVTCLGNAEQMGEGWSDWIGLMMTMKPGDTDVKARGIGTYASGQSTTGGGIRPAPYSTDFGVNSYTYGATNNTTLSQPHGIGFVWATMLWDMSWAMIDTYGFDEDLYNGKGGNNMAMQLVIDGLKLQECRPGFVNGRDAILKADRINYGGANQELIWKVFAKRGLGFSAKQGSSASRIDQVQAFDLPATYACTIPLNVAAVQSSTVYTGGVANNLYIGYGPKSVVLQASGDATNTYSWSPATGLSNAKIANPVFTPTAAGTYTFTVTATNADQCIKTKTITINVVDVRCGDNKKKDKVMVCVDGENNCADPKAVNMMLTKAGGKLGDCSLNISAPVTATTVSELAVDEADDFVQSYPNPFSESTTIVFKAKETAYTVLKVYDITGREVETLFEGNAESGVTYNHNFKAGDKRAGIYIYKIVNGNTSRSGTMVLIK
ncbi:T9SS-dependent M36 family metallopeptidase [Pontibacter sp. BT310]|uniref:T9SS-dependent M36 family metallopeptidase n=1 Tax=Pontibacter populi TaxID=890055 RepID=A0ABS6XGK8_9BACT|nr:MULTISPECIES: T9SS-dependent M36 family metallopeptidase [Pontibacter]MBJ6119451.1 T9SS-dependent M36 family metallopeptidase [Pontibacter sp. BT310]MBR0571879.1 T9SS-dependent M36 family metallopeptidase [Microvirga sp. STS03]MBW3366305.1 T9SS-dependent M36 family metallopeptidase [Pontibacter populi]